MPSGHYLTEFHKQMLVFYFRRDYTAEGAWNAVFKCVPDYERPTLEHIRRLWGEFPTMTEIALDEYHIDHASIATRGKRKRFFKNADAADTIVLDRILKENRSILIRSLRQQFIEEFYTEIVDFYQRRANLPSISAVYRAVNVANSRKLRVKVHSKADPEVEYEFLKRIEHINADDLIDIDGMIQHKNDFYQRYGWAPPGEVVKCMQITINNISYPVHAAYTVNGFVHWKVFQSNVTVTEETVKDFVRELATKNIILENSFALLDNASNQRSRIVRIALEEVFRGKYCYCAPYAPWLKPIEKGFSLVKRLIRSLEYDTSWRNNPIGLINHAFHHYSAGSIAGQIASEHFNIYRRNHAFFLDRRASVAV
jgi:transposase